MLSTVSKKERFLQAAAGGATDRPPVWLMRQAGRFMPEYQALRRQYSFRELCRNPEAAAAASLLPLQILDVDILIIFNDILIPLEEMGIRIEFPDGGPQIMNPLETADDLGRFTAARFSDPPVAQSLRRLRAEVGAETPILGFCGAPFTLASYAVEGRMSKTLHRIMGLRYRAPRVLHEILARITETAGNYLISQIGEGGADGVQIFDTWAGILTPADYEEFAAFYQRRLIEKVKQAGPGVPIILFVKGGANLLEAMANSGADVLSIDWTISLAHARRRVALPLQGNLDPTVLTVPEAVDAQVERMLDGFDWRRGWIANLGHGLFPQCRVEAVRRFVRKIQSLGDQRHV